MNNPFGNSGPQVKRDPKALSIVDPHDFLASELPEFAELLWHASLEQHALATQTLSHTGIDYALRLVATQAINDFTDLLSDLGQGQGRSAMRAARALIEHGVNAHTVAASTTDAQRYLDHLDQGRAVVWTLEPGADLFPGREAQRYLRKLRKLGQPAQRRFDAAVRKYGAPFRRGWHAENLRDRANRFGIGDLYEYYRLGSLVSHGAGGGALGSTREHPEGFRTLRQGPALELAPIAYLAGLYGYREVLNALEGASADLNVPAFSDGLAALEESWPDYFAAMQKLDEQLWPDVQVQSPTVVYAFAQNGRERWFIHLPHQGVLLPAERPVLPSGHEEQLRSVVDNTLTHQRHLFTADQRFVTVAVLGVHARPRGNKGSVADTAFLPIPEGPVDFRELQLDDPASSAR